MTSRKTITFGGGRAFGKTEALRQGLKNAAKTARRRSDRADEEAYEAAVEDDDAWWEDDR